MVGGPTFEGKTCIFTDNGYTSCSTMNKILKTLSAELLIAFLAIHSVKYCY